MGHRLGLLAALGLVAALSGCGSTKGSDTVRQSRSTDNAPAGVSVRIPTAGMAPTLPPGAIVTVDVQAYKHAKPRRGDIVLFVGPAAAGPPSRAEMRKALDAIKAGRKPPPSTECSNHKAGEGHPRMCDAVPHGLDRKLKLVKRVVAVAGDRILMRAGKVIVNGRAEATLGVRGCSRQGCSFPQPIVIPHDTVFLLGDNRGNSDDSRFWGPMQTPAVLGRVAGH